MMVVKYKIKIHFCHGTTGAVWDGIRSVAGVRCCRKCRFVECEEANLLILVVEKIRKILSGWSWNQSQNQS